MSGPVLAQLIVYPIKGASGFSPRSWTVDGLGLRLDRRWMLVDASGCYISQRTQPRLTLVQALIDGDTLRLSADGHGSTHMAVGDGRERATRARAGGKSEAVLRVAKPCDHRCGVPNVEQETGFRGVEPLKALATYRRFDGGLFLGQNVVIERAGELRRGDPVEVLERGAPRPATTAGH